MGQTYVYNAGEQTPPTNKEMLLEFGMFFDGTGNNHRNVEIRKKVFKLEEYADQSKPENVATPKEKKIYEEEHQTTKNSWFWKTLANSFMNDFSNVARMWRNSNQKKYGIYIEGIGTEDEKDDDTQGSAFGTGNRGILRRVCKGCEKLAEKVADKINSNTNKKITPKITLTLDVFGFSRGAAAARNFVYEVQKAAYAPKMRPSSMGPGMRSHQTYRDDFGNLVTETEIVGGKLPKNGYLGLSLKRKKIDDEILENLIVKIRFVGIYDTVASYRLHHNNDIKQLHLNDLGNPIKVVHFTAMDEHRENFSLSKIKANGKNFIEKNFPGVHSDIGGGYDNGAEYIDELETDYVTTIASRLISSNDPLEKFKNKVIKEGWFTEKDTFRVHSGPVYRHLSVKRAYVHKEYSYLMLHYMKDYTKECLKDENFKENFIEAKLNSYSIDRFPELIQAKKVLDTYVKNQRAEWVLTNTDTVEDKLLKKLRNKYFHWSADYDWVGMNPTSDRIRKIIPNQ